MRILLVDDSSDDAAATLRALHARFPAGEVHWVQDGAQALDFVFCTGRYAGREPDPPRAILLDVKMPKLDGIEVLRRLKGSELRAVPVFVMVSSSEEQGVLESYGLGAAGYVVKPVQAAALFETLAKIGL